MQAQPPGPPLSMPSSSTAVPDVDVSIWRAVAGASVKVPAVNSYVYYFPQGHLEQCSASAAAASYNFTFVRPWIPCHVISVRFLTDPASDQAFARILLQPLLPFSQRPSCDENGSDGGVGDDDVVSFAKVLTRSDANNGGGFSVPRFCADMILPPLDFEADPPVQNLVLRDTHNNAWEFRHIYRGTPRRHLLTTGWSKFVNAKRLVAGDSVVFMKKRSTNELFVGIRRAERFGGDGSSDSGEVVAAIESGLRGLPFEAVYYPKVGSPDFVVMAEKVKDALRMRWGAGMRVRMTVETDDASRLTWIQGVVIAVSPPLTGIWCGSPWRMLQVNWDDYESSNSQNMNKVNPWQVDYVPISPLIDPSFPPAKRYRFFPDSGSGVLPAEETRAVHTLSPTAEFSHPIAGNLNSSLHYYSPFPGGMQGARRNHMVAAAAANVNRSYPQLQLAVNELPRLERVPDPPLSTVLSIGSSYSDTVSPVSQSSVQSGCGGAVSSIQLFGKTIQTTSEDGGSGDGVDTCNGNCTCGGERCDANKE